MRKIRLSTNQSRLLYDLTVYASSALVACGFLKLFTGHFEPWFAAVPPLGLLANYAVGIYDRFRVATGFAKTGVISAAVLSVSIVLFAVTGSVQSVALWAALAWAPLVLPRIFLNIHRQKKLSTIGKTFAGALRDRGPVLVVGGAGYIGTHVVSQLLADGRAVRVLDRLFYGPESIQEFQKNPKFEFIEGDVTDIGKLVLGVEGASAVVHLAGLVGDPACSIDDRYTTHCNIIATRMLKEVAQSFGVQRFIFSSSCSVYGANEHVVDETSPLNPVSLYARTKIESEKELMTVLGDEFFVTILRFATVFGHSRRPRFDLVGNLFTAQAFVDGKITVQGGHQYRPFVHVRDLARAIVLVLNSPPESVQGQIFNVGDESLNVTIGQLAEIIKNVVSRERQVEILARNDVTDARNYRVSFEKIRKQLGFRTSTSLEDGVKEILHEFKRGTYNDYHLPKFSNLEMTKESVVEFQNPRNSAKLYAPLTVVNGD